MKKTINILIIITVITCGISGIKDMAYGVIKPGDFFPEMFFDLSSDKTAQKYLNLKGDRKINISDIDADVLILEVLSVYCVSCMAQAPFDRELFMMIDHLEKTSGRVKMIGIAVGNNQREVDKFINKHETPYPVFTDPDFSKYDRIGQVRTPFKIFFLRKVDNRFQVIKTELGVHRDINATFRTIVDILDGKYSAEEKIEPAATQKKSINADLIDSLLKTWLEQRGKSCEVKELFEDPEKVVYKIGSKAGLFAVLINRVSVCDVCKDVQFIYVIDSLGKVIDLIPIQLSKKYNVSFKEEDIAKIKGALIDRNINEDIEFDSKVDAITSATITTGIIYNSINKGAGIYSLLKQKGFIK